MKSGHAIAINRKRAKDRPGGEMATLDPVAQGRVQVLDCPPDDLTQARAALDELLRLSRLDPDWTWAKAESIALDWRRLAPVRAYAEALGIPVEMANETLPSIWRLRKMRQFIAAMRREPTYLLSIHDLVEMKNAIPSNRWTDLIAEGIATLAHELNTRSMPVPDLIEWFAEWARDMRCEQRSLLLLTAHRAKGLEFDDVVIFNGGWDGPGKGEDADAPRRLFYVAMTRARRSLTMMADAVHPFVLPRGEHVLRRTAPPVAPDSTATKVYQVPDLKTVDLSWAGRRRGGNPALAAIASTKVGDPIRLTRRDDTWVPETSDGQPLGRMARSWSPPHGLAFVRGEIGAIIRWRKTYTGQE